MTTNFQKTSAWFKTAGKEQNEKNLSTQIGVHISEFVEMLREISIISNTGLTSTAAEEIAAVLDAVARVIVDGTVHVVVHDRVALLDSLCDQDVTLNGIAYLAGFDKDGADAEVHRSNFSKFEDGKALLAPGGKIMKGASYTPPVLDPFVPKETQEEVQHVPV